MPDPLPDLRSAIDRLDQELVRILNERAAVARRIGEAKAAKGEAIFVPHRESEVFRRIQALNQGPLSEVSLQAIWREVMSASFALERPLTICHFGQPGAFTSQAARLKFGASVAYTSVEDITGVFAEVERSQADYGVVPIENSTDGSITDTIDAFLATRLRIVSELHLRIRHHLMSRSPRAQVKRVYSRHTVFRQCRTWLATHLPGVELVETVSTTKAAERAASEEGSAAMGPEDAATAFGLPILASDCQDNAGNVTRFVVIAPPERAAAPSGNDKTTLMFAVQDRPGALFDCLTPFHKAGINLCRIESRPSRRRAWEYLFFIDLTGHQLDPAVAAGIADLRQQTAMLEILGSYPQAERPLNE